MKGKLTS
jgi:hypothetical protein